MCYTYAGLLRKHNADGVGSAASFTQVFDIDFEFLQVDAELVAQKEQAVILAEMCIILKPNMSDKKVNVQ